MLTGERSGTADRLTDSLRVRLVAVNVDERKIDFVPAEVDTAAPLRESRRTGRRRG